MGDIGKFIAQKRKERGLTQGELAELSGMSFDWVKSVEYGRNPSPRLDTLAKVAPVLRVELSTLAELAGRSAEGLEHVPHVISPERHQALHTSFLTLQRLSPKRLAEVQAYLETLADMDEWEFQRGRRQE